MKKYIAVILTFAIACNVCAFSAHKIIDTSGVKGGLVVVVGCKDYELPVQLMTSDSYLVVALDTDPEKVEKVRNYAKGKGLYGKVSAHVFDGKSLPYSDSLVNLIIINDNFKVPANECKRVLTPRGILLTQDDSLNTQLPSFIPRSKMHEGWFMSEKPVPREIDDWTHFLYGPGNNAVSKDSIVGPVSSLKWNCGPLWSRSHEFTSSLNILVSAGGRVFYVVDEGLTSVHTDNIPEKWALIARDAFNGKRLWKRPLPQWRSRLGKNTNLRAVPPTAQRCIVADGSRVYVSSVMGAEIKEYDAATGEILKEYKQTAGTREFVKVGNSIILYMEKDTDKGEGNICRLDLDSGNILWSTEKDAYKGESLAATENHVIFHNKKALVCLDFDNGKRLWDTASAVQQNQKKRRLRAQFTYILHKDTALVCSSSIITAYQASSGDTLWQRKTGGKAMRGQDSFVIRGCVWHADGDKITGYDLKTGKPSQTVDPSDVYSKGHHLRCYRAKATENYLITQYRGLEFVSINGKENSQSDWTRGACSFGVVPANGLMYVPPNPCFCYPGVLVRGLNAYGALQVKDKTQQPKERLIKGTAYGKIHKSQSMKYTDAWPTYRKGPQRHGSSNTNVAQDVEVKWKVDLGDKVTPPVMAYGKVYVAVKDEHTVYALNEKDGSTAWSFVTESRVDSPPTLYKGMAFFGSADGYLYCVTAESGELIWKFRAAPAERLIMSFDQLESTWPVHGSVLVKNDVVYCTAGRSSMLDGGIWIYGIDPATGKVLRETNINTLKRIRDDFQGKPLIPSYNMEGANSDILVSEGEHIYMGPMMFDLKLNRIETPLAMDPKRETVAMDISKADYITADKELQKDRYEKYKTHNYQEKAWPQMTKEYKAKYGGINLGDMKMGRHIAPTAGFLDDTWFNRTYWMYSDVWPGWYHAHRGAKSGNLLVVGAKQTYALQAYPERNRQSPLFTPQSKGYLLVVDDNENEPVLDHLTRGATKGLGYTRMKPPTWHKWLPVRIRGMVETDKTLFAAGPPDVVDKQDPYASFEGRMGAKLLAIDTKTGEVISQMTLDSPPVFDGLIAAGGKLFMTTIDGSVVCME